MVGIWKSSGLLLLAAMGLAHEARSQASGLPKSSTPGWPSGPTGPAGPAWSTGSAGAEPLALGPRSAAPPSAGGGGEPALFLQFVNTDIAVLAGRLGAMLGRQVRVDARVKGAVQLKSEQAVTAQQAWALFTEVLARQNIRVVAEPSGYFITLPSVVATEAADKTQLAAGVPLGGPRPGAKANPPNAAAALQPEISVEWAPTPRPTLPRVSQAPRPDMVALAEPVAIWALQTQDRTLYHSLNRWAQAAQWQLMWEAERDFPIQAQVSFEGGFTAAIEAVMSALAGSDYPLQAIMNSATRVVSIVRHQQLTDR